MANGNALPPAVLAVLAHLLALALLSASQRAATRRSPADSHDVAVHLDLDVEFQREPRVHDVVDLLAITGSLGHHGPTPSAHVRSNVPAARMQATSRPLSPSHPRRYRSVRHSEAGSSATTEVDQASTVTVGASSAQAHCCRTGCAGSAWCHPLLQDMGSSPTVVYGSQPTSHSRKSEARPRLSP